MIKRKHPVHPQPLKPKSSDPRAVPADATRGNGPEGLVWLYGRHAVEAAIRNPNRQKLRFLSTGSAARSLAGRLPLSPLNPEIVDSQELTRLLPAGAVHQGMGLQVKPLEEPSLADICARRPDSGPRIVVLLDQVSDPQNVGAILRSCAVFGALALIVTQRNAPPASGVLAKAASGALDLVPLLREINLARTLDQLAELGFWRVGLDEHAPQPVAEIDLSGDIAVVLGAEGEGMRQLTARKCDFLARLPARASLASLNVSNAAAVMLYEITRRRTSV